MPATRSDRHLPLFVYGELCKPRVVRELIGRVPCSRPALLPGYGRRLNPDTGYFRAVPVADALLAGLLLEGIEVDELAALDRFENIGKGEYERAAMEVEDLDGETVMAWVYVAAQASDASSVGRRGQ